MEAIAHAKYLRISPRKVKLICDVIRGRDADDAAAILAAMPHSAAEYMAKLLKSACANAENNFNMDPAKLYVKSVSADPGPILKRMQPVGRGRGHRINKRTSHITLVVAEKE